MHAEASETDLAKIQAILEPLHKNVCMLKMASDKMKPWFQDVLIPIFNEKMADPDNEPWWTKDQHPADLLHWWDDLNRACITSGQAMEMCTGVPANYDFSREMIHYLLPPTDLTEFEPYIDQLTSKLNYLESDFRKAKDLWIERPTKDIITECERTNACWRLFCFTRYQVECAAGDLRYLFWAMAHWIECANEAAEILDATSDSSEDDEDGNATENEVEEDE